MKNKHNNRGMTLIEVLLSIAIFAIVLQVGYSMFFSGNKSFIIGSNRGHAQQDARIVAEHLNKELRYSSILSDSNLTGRYFSIEIVENEDGTNTLNKTEYDTGAIKEEKRLVNGTWDIIQLKKTNRIIEAKIVIEENNNTIYSLPLSIPLENINNASSLDIDLSNGEKIYFALAEDTYITNNPNDDDPPNDNNNPPNNEEPEEPEESDDSEEEVYQTWTPGVIYSINTIVSHNGRNYKRRTTWGDSEVPGDNFQVWQEYSDIWLSYNVYFEGDVVLHEGVRYRSKQWNTGMNPSTVDWAWQKID